MGNDGSTPVKLVRKKGGATGEAYMVSGGDHGLDTPIEVSTLSALHSAVAKHETEQVEKLLTRDNVGLTDSAGNAALHVAAAFGFVDLVRLILNTGADVDQRTNDGGTPLHLACIKGHLDCVRVLVEWGADLSKETRIHKTPLMYAQSHRHKAIVKFLESWPPSAPPRPSSSAEEEK